MPFLLYVLALAVFAQGTSEFALAGLLPAVAADLDISTGLAGLLTSTYALGMIIGAPLIAAFGRGLPPRWTMAALLTVFVGAHVAAALTGSFTTLLASRMIASLANAGFLAVALTTVNLIVPPDERARGLAVIIGGTTISLIVGVPVGAAIGEVFGWRVTMWAIAMPCLPALFAVFASAPLDSPGGRKGTAPKALRTELSVLARRPFQLMAALTVLVNGATFCSFTYLAVVATDLTGMTESRVPMLLALFGVGALSGTTLAGRFADAHWRRLLTAAIPALLAGWACLALEPPSSLLTWPLVTGLGILSFAVGSTLIARMMAESEGAPGMSGAFSTVALNIGAVIGPVLGGISWSLIGTEGIPLTSAALACLALLLWSAAQ